MLSATKTIVQANRKPRGVTYRNTDGQALRTESADAPIWATLRRAGGGVLRWCYACPPTALIS